MWMLTSEQPPSSMVTQLARKQFSSVDEMLVINSKTDTNENSALTLSTKATEAQLSAHIVFVSTVKY